MTPRRFRRSQRSGCLKVGFRLFVGASLLFYTFLVWGACTQRHERPVRDFYRITGFPHGRPGYVVDHIIPLACGGADAVSNLRWQTVAEGKAKDLWERTGCPPCGKAYSSKTEGTPDE